MPHRRMPLLTNQYRSKNGIIFKDFYGNNNTGDHIDLLYHVNTQIRTATGDYTNDSRVKQIWFWGKLHGMKIMYIV